MDLIKLHEDNFMNTLYIFVKWLINLKKFMTKLISQKKQKTNTIFSIYNNQTWLYFDLSRLNQPPPPPKKPQNKLTVFIHLPWAIQFSIYNNYCIWRRKCCIQGYLSHVTFTLLTGKLFWSILFLLRHSYF